jgi:hypothetical protein
MTDASDLATGAVLQQFINQKLQPAERKYSTFDRELLAVYRAIKHFRHFVEGHPFSVYTDHKPLTFSLHTKSDKYSPRQLRHLDFIAQFTRDIQHIQGSKNPVADALTSVELNSVISNTPSGILDFHKLVSSQNNCDFHTQEAPNHSLRLEKYSLPNSNLTITCDVSTGIP